MFTYWTLEITCVNIACSILCMHVIEKPSYTLRRFTHLTFEAAFVMNFTVLIIYWPFLHFQCIFDYPLWIQVIHMTTVHSLPSLMFYINWRQMDICICRSDGKYLITMGTIYAICNCLQTWISGEPVYPFLTWDSFVSPLIIGCIMGVLLWLYTAFVGFSFWVKPHMKPTHSLLKLLMWEKGSKLPPPSTTE